ncbi:MAG: hypothetical protein ACTSSF_09240, partial [Candidatus Heimdallarchaeaceae archaeon]
MTMLRDELEKKTAISFAILREKNKIDIVISMIIAIVLFALSLYFKNLISSKIFEKVGRSFYYSFLNSSGTKVTWYFENYGDDIAFYQQFLSAFLFDRWNPYARSEGVLDYYVYGPVFIYSLVLFYGLVFIFHPGFSKNVIVVDSVKWFAIVSDSLSVVMLYLLIIELDFLKNKRILKHFIGIIGAVFLAFMPMNLFYVDTYHLNIPQMTFFTLLGLYFFIKNNFKLSAGAFTIGWLSKQIPLFLVIPLFFILAKKENVKFALKRFLLPFIGFSFLLSIPWIFTNPLLYPVRLFGAGRPLWYATLTPEGIQHGVTLAHTILYFGAEILAQIYVYINLSMLPFLITYFIAVLMSYVKGKELAENQSLFVNYVGWFFILIHTFLSRGVFKYYDAFLNPFFILMSIVFAYNFRCLIKKIFGNEKIKVSEEGIEILTPLERIFYNTFFVFTILLLLGSFFGLNWLIMITVRFLHPLILLCVLIVLSFLIPLDFYKVL